MDMSSSTYILGIIVAIILAAALVVFILWLLCPSTSNSCETDCIDTCKPKNCGWSGSNTANSCKTKACGGLSGSSQWSGGAWPGSGDWFSGRIGEKEADC